MGDYALEGGASAGFAKPRPLHTLTPGALAAVESMRTLSAQRKLEHAVSAIVTDVGRPRYDGDPVTASARALLAAAERNGWRTHLEVGSDFCSVHGARTTPERVGFTATWTRGSADVARWRSAWRYELVHDDRTVAVDARAHVGKVGHRAAGVDEEHLSIVASPLGVRVSFAELKRRVVAL